MEAQESISTLHEKLQSLIREFQRCSRENDRLKEQLQQARDMHANQTNKLETLEQQMAIENWRDAKLSTRDKQEFSKKLNQYIKDIEKIIAYMGQ